MAPRPTAPDHAIASHRRCRRRGITARVQSGCGHGPVPWGLSGRYTHVVDFTDGSQLAYGCRERPHMVLDRHGSIVGLTNGAAEQTCHSDDPPVVDYSYTLLQAVGPARVGAAEVVEA